MIASASFRFVAMGTNCELQLYAESPELASRVAEGAIAEIERIERAYSRYRPDTIVHAINLAARSAGTVCVDAETADLLDRALEQV